MINIQDIIPFMKDGWVAMDSRGNWWWFEMKPVKGKEYKLWHHRSSSYLDLRLSVAFDIAPADDWTKSLIKVGGK